MAAVSTVIAATALAVSTVGVVSAGIAAKNQADFQAEVAQQQANRAKQVAEVNESDFRKKVSRALATSRAGLAGAGGELSGSQLLSLEDFVAEAEVDALNIRQGGQVQSNRLMQQASLFQASGKNAQTAGFVRGGSQLLTGFSGLKFGGGGVSDSTLEPQLFDEG